MESLWVRHDQERFPSNFHLEQGFDANVEFCTVGWSLEIHYKIKNI